MEAKFVQGSSICADKNDKADTSNWHANAAKELNQGQELGEPVKIDEVGVKNKVHHFYFPKFWLFEDQNVKSRIGEAQKLIEKMDQEKSSVAQKYENMWRSYKARVCTPLKRLRNRESRIKMALDTKTRKLDDLQEALHKLSFSKNSNPKTATKMVHRPNNLTIEKKLLREINESEKKRAVNSYSSVEEFSEFIRWFFGKIECQNDKRLKNKIFKKIKRLEKVGKGDTADATEKGKIGNPLNSRKDIQDLARLINKISEELSKEHLEVLAKKHCVEKDSEVDEDIYRLAKQLNDFWLRREEAGRHIQNLRKQQDESKTRYDKYVSVMSNARELARKKDVKALQELSLREVDIFMCHWNRSKAFRRNYEKSISQSLDHHSLHEEPIILEAPTSIEPALN